MASTPTIDGKLTIDVQRLLETRLLLQASSGGGKSFALRRLLEQTANQVQQLIIDPDGEFSTLREKFDYIIAAPQGGDAVADARTAALLVRRLLESGVSAIMDIYELKPHERTAFVREFCNALVNAPKKLWRPVLVVIDEAHVYCPEKGKGQADSGSAIIDLATRGRKRGFGLALATQRLSKLNKDAAAECLNKMIGMTGLPADRARAADELGMAAKEAGDQLRGMEPGQFFVYGPAFARELTQVKVGPVKTTHPEPGARALEAPPAPSTKIKKALADLADLPKEAEKEAKSLADLKRENTELKRKLTQAEKQQTGVPEAEVQKRIQAAVADVKQAQPATDTKSAKALEKIARIANDALTAAPQSNGHQKPAGRTVTVTANQSSDRQVTTHGELSGPEQRILDALIWLESANLQPPFSRVQVAFIAGYKPNAGAFNNPLGRLRSAGYIEYPAAGKVAITPAGAALANTPDKAMSNDELHQRILARLNGPQQRILTPLLEVYPNSLSREELASRAGYTANAGAFNNPLGSMRSLGIIDYPQTGYVVAADTLFPMEK